MASIFDPTMGILSKSLDLYLLRHNITSDNIANAETPGFKARRVDFEDQLNRTVEAQETGNETLVNQELGAVKANVSEEANSELGNDLNTVDMDKEMAVMTKNDIKYSAASQAITKKMALLKYAISEGGER